MKKIKYLVMDVDGTLTDGRIYMTANGEFCKVFNIKDGYGIKDILIPAGIIPIIITARRSEIVLKRCQELDIKYCFQGVTDKSKALIEVTENIGADLSTTAYMGDDINDLKCMGIIKRAGGLVGCPADSENSIIQISDFVSKYRGGDGAVRDFIEWLIKSV